MTLVKVDSEEKKISNFASKEARRNRNVRFSEPKLLDMATQGGGGAAVGDYNSGNVLSMATASVGHGHNQTLQPAPFHHHSNQTIELSQRSPQLPDNHMTVPVDSTSQKKQGGSGFLPRINSSEGPLV